MAGLPNQAGLMFVKKSAFCVMQFTDLNDKFMVESVSKSMMFNLKKSGTKRKIFSFFLHQRVTKVKILHINILIKGNNRHY